MQTWQSIVIVVIVFGFVWGNLALLRYSAKFDMKKFNQDPIEKAKAALAEKKALEEAALKNEKQQVKKNEHS